MWRTFLVVRCDAHRRRKVPQRIDALDGWEKVPSRSRPGQFSFKNLQTGDVYEKIPAAVKYRVKFG